MAMVLWWCLLLVLDKSRAEAQLISKYRHALFYPEEEQKHKPWGRMSVRVFICLNSSEKGLCNLWSKEEEEK